MSPEHRPTQGHHASGAESYPDKLRRIEPQTLVPELPPATRDALRGLALTYRFTQQELRIVAQAARDLEMWCEQSLHSWWERAENSEGRTGRSRKKALLGKLGEHMSRLAETAKTYPPEGLEGPERRTPKLESKDTNREIFGLCAAYSDQTVCCGLRTIDAVRGCVFGCSYCTIQTFYPEASEIESSLPQKLAALQLDPGREYHIGTGQSSDSLVWGNRGGALEALLEFARGNPNVLLELKTKSNNTRYLLERELPPNVVCSWSLNTETVIRNEEHGTASLPDRLKAARGLADRGQRVAFHFHPMMHYKEFEEDYTRVAQSLLDSFTSEEVAFVSMGSVTLIKPVVREIRLRGGSSKILQMPHATDPHGKLTYPDEIKLNLFNTLYRALSPWHGRVFFYLCMETAPLWEAVFGRVYEDNVTFERDFLRCCPPIPRAQPKAH